MRWIGAILVVVLSGCTSVKLVQRDGCWVRRTEQWLGGVTEEIGPCALPAPPWVEDRLTRLVQECVARADYRWQSQALAAWNRGEALPRQDEGNLLKECMSEASGAMLTEKEALQARLGEVSADRDALRAKNEEDRAHMRASHEKLAGFLGEAAKKAAPPATATATASSDGRASHESSAGMEVPSLAVVGAVPAAAPSEAAARTEPLRRARSGKKEVRPAVARSKPLECPAPAAAATLEAHAPPDGPPGLPAPEAASAKAAAPAVPAAPAADGAPR